jgi:hypothetical protein
LPQEIVPLQQELNALLKSNQDIVERARTHVGNLAHALKTPLARHRHTRPATIQAPLRARVSEQAEIMGTQISLYLDPGADGRTHRRDRAGDRGASGRGNR